jgi:hypothetical protein
MFPQGSESVNSITLAHNFAITGCVDGKVRIYDIRSGELARRVDCHTSVNCLDVTADERIVVAGTSSGTVVLCDPSLGLISLSARIHSQSVNSVSVQPNGSFILSGSDDTTTILSDFESLEPVFTITAHKDKVCSVRFSSDGSTFTTNSFDHRAIIWRSPDLNSPEPEKEIESDDEVPAQKIPPIPEPEPERRSEANIESSPLRKSGDSGHSSGRRSGGQSSATVSIGELSGTELTDDSEMFCVNMAYQECGRKPRIRSSITSIKETPGVKKDVKISPEDVEFQDLLKRAALEMRKLEHSLWAIGERMQRSSERIAKLEAHEANVRYDRASINKP